MKTTYPPNNKNWILTDPDRKQYGRKLSNNIFEFKEFNENENDWEIMTINLNHYNNKQIEYFISGYYSSLEEINKIYKEQSDWIIAECIFEQEIGLY